MNADVVIIGGGVVGSSIAYHLRTDGFRGRVLVVERDPDYRRASSALAMGGIRQQFNSALNIRMVQWSVEFYRRFDKLLAAGGHTVRTDFRQRGYLFLVNAEARERSERRFELQRRLGARVRRLDRHEIRELVPDLKLDDIEFGVLGPDDGYANPREVLAGLRAVASAAGVDYVQAEVIEVRRQGDRVAGVWLAGGEKIESPVVVNAAGPFAARVGAMAGLKLPVQPVRQHLFRCALPRRWPYRFPMVVDPTGVHWRHDDPASPADRDRIIVARTRPDEPAGENFDCDPSRWTKDFLPPLLDRMPALAGLELLEGWVGLYEMTPDHNALIGEHPALRGFYLANGFSGHGLMMAPATGKVMSELIRLGRAQTVDVGALQVGRFERGELIHDEAMI